MDHTGRRTIASQICRDAIPYAAGAILLGVVTIAVRDFALQWEPVPAAIGGRVPLAVMSGVILILGGLAALWTRAGRYRLLLPLFFGLWALLLHLPVVIAKPYVGSLLGLAEILSIALGGLGLLHWPPGASSTKAARIVYGICPLVFGLSHFVYVDITASMVPAWLPARHFWAWFTGAAHIAAGAAIVTGLFARQAASLLASMCGGFVLLVHIPRVAAAPADRGEWTALAVALCIAGAAWLVRNLLNGAGPASRLEASDG